MLLVKPFGAVDGIISIKTHLKGALGFSEFLDLAFLFIEDILHDVQKGSGYILRKYLPKHYHYPQPTMIWCICDLIFDVKNLEQFPPRW